MDPHFAKPKALRKRRINLNFGGSTAKSRKGEHRGEGALQAPEKRAVSRSESLADVDGAGRSDNQSEATASADCMPPENEEVNRRPAKRRKQQSQDQRRENEEENYRNLRPHAQHMLTRQDTVECLADLASSLKAGCKDFVEGAARTPRCPRCGEQGQDKQPESVKDVILITQYCLIRVSIPIFQCDRCPAETLFHINPLLAGAFPGTPVHGMNLTTGASSSERIWFGILLLDHLLLSRKNNARITIESTTKTIFEHHKMSGGESLIQEDTVRKLLGKTLEEYENIRTKLLLEVLDVAEDPAAPGGRIRACPACAGLTVRDPITQREIFLLHSIYVDGNFRLVHETGRGRATKHDPPLQHFFAPKAEVEEFCSQAYAGRNKLPPGDENLCNDFNADSQLGRTPAKYDLTGVFAGFCRHGIILGALNMATGERWAYATLLLAKLLKQQIVPQFFWYDINCRYKGHFQRWLEGGGAEGVAPEVLEKAKGMSFPLPSWHHSMHNAQCQEQNSFRRMTGAGRGAGEPPEQAWSQLGPWGNTTKYMSHANRMTTLEKQMVNFVLAKQDSLPGLLLKMHARAAEQEVDVVKEISELYEAATRAGISEEELVAALRAGNTTPADSLAGLGAEGWYVGLLLELEEIQQRSGGRVSAHLVTATVSQTERMHFVQRKLKVERLIRELQESRGWGWWQHRSLEFEAGFRQLGEHQKARLQRKAERETQYLMFVQESFARHGERQVTKKLRRIKESQQKKVAAAVQAWLEWDIAVSSDNTRDAAAAAKPSQSVLTEAYQGKYPWSSDENAGQLEAFVVKLGLLLDLRSRAKEERKLVLREATGAVASLGQQLARMDTRLQEVEAELVLLRGTDAGLALEEAYSAEVAIHHKVGFRKLLSERRSAVDELQTRFRDVCNSLQTNQDAPPAPEPSSATATGEDSDFEEEILELPASACDAHPDLDAFFDEGEGVATEEMFQQWGNAIENSLLESSV